MIYKAGVNVTGGCQCLTADGRRLYDVQSIDTERKRLVRYFIPFQVNEDGTGDKTYEMTFESVDISFMKWENGVESEVPNKFVIHGLKTVE